MMNERELMDLKNRIDQAKSKVSELNGRRSYLLQELKANYDCGSVEEAQIQIEKMDKDIEKLQQRIQTGVQSLEEAME